MRAEKAASPASGWLLQWRARFEAEAGGATIARHFYARAVNAAPQDSSVWQMWAEMEAALGEEERAAVLARHAQVVEAETLLLAETGTGALRRNPLARTDA